MVVGKLNIKSQKPDIAVSVLQFGEKKWSLGKSAETTKGIMEIHLRNWDCECYSQNKRGSKNKEKSQRLSDVCQEKWAGLIFSFYE